MTMMISVDRQDLALLGELQRNGETTNAVLSERLNLSVSQVGRRVQRLEEAGIIDHYAAVLEPMAVGLDVMAFVHITLDRHGEQRGEHFEQAIADLPEVLECFSVTGEADYVARVVSQNLASFSELMMKRILRLPGVTNVKSNIALKRVKQSTVLPLDHIAHPSPSKQRLQFMRT
jgi:Lrp/AsnC family transcriptional regulator, leucine-responsive regulatory protein